ncbi:VOC family protein [Jannaschia sp. W003]|uniref:VOC family protein n=1 Tax=Jannaschia sp. W003 TaxID=2867012 RepID=UPI0021A4E1A8|nr:VOC family protein [Jannaschia sp. W003]UWQ21466.1 VOC family protein [Jannaschia sp. W003]
MNRITLVTLGVADLEAARAFYGRLGWRECESHPGVAFFDCGGWRMGLFALDALAEELGRPRESLGTGASTLAVNFPTPEETDRAFAEALAAGAAEVRAPRAMDWGGHSGTWADPDGHLWEYACNPFWPMDADGRLKGA